MRVLGQCLSFAILIVAKAFRDFDSLDELPALIPPDGEMVQLHWKASMFDKPFFKSTSARKALVKIETAGAFSKRLAALGHRAGYPRPPTIHDFRAEGLYWIGMCCGCFLSSFFSDLRMSQTNSTPMLRE